MTACSWEKSREGSETGSEVVLTGDSTLALPSSTAPHTLGVHGSGGLIRRHSRRRPSHERMNLWPFSLRFFIQRIPQAKLVGNPRTMDTDFRTVTYSRNCHNA
jgi:hypothetical protein